MTIQEMYAAVGGDYSEIISRFKTEDRVIKFTGMFPRDTSYQLLCSSMESGNIDEAFRAAHTLKGLCANLAFSRLQKSSSEITELLRAHKLDEAKAYLPTVTEHYEQTVAAIKEALG